MKHLFFALFACCFAASNSVAQEMPAQSLADVQSMFAAGEKVKVIDAAGKVTQGEVVGLTPASLRLKTRGNTIEWQQADIREIQKRRKDPGWNGALYGALAGAATGIGVVASMCPNDSECRAITTIVFLPTGVAVGAAAGALIDFSIKKFDTIFKVPGISERHSIRLAPVLSNDRKGIALSFSF